MAQGTLNLFLVSAIMLCAVGLSRGNDTSARPEVGANTGSRLSVFKFFSCFADKDPSFCFSERTSRALELWIQSDPKLRSLAFKEMKMKPNEKGVLDTMGEGVLKVVDNVLTDMALQRIEGKNDSVNATADQGVDGSGMARGLNRGSGLGTPFSSAGGLSAAVHTTRLVAGGFKKKFFFAKFYFLIKVIIYALIAKTKIALVLFKILILIKLKFLGLAVIHTIIQAAKFYNTKSSQHSEKSGGESHDKGHNNVVHEPYFGGHGYGGGAYGGYGQYPMAYRGWYGGSGNKNGGLGAGGGWSSGGGGHGGAGENGPIGDGH